MTDQLDALIERAQDLVKTAEQRITEQIASGHDEIERAMEVRRLYEFSHSAGSAAQARQHMAELVERRERRDAALTDHAAAVEQNRTALGKLGKDLAKDRAALGKKVEAAIGVLLDLWDSADAYNAALADRAAALHEAGIDAQYRDGDVVHRHDDGMVDPRENPWGTVVLKLDGEEWHRLMPEQVLDWAHEAARRGRRYSTLKTEQWPVHAALAPLVNRPDPAPAPPSPWAGRPSPASMNAPVNRPDGMYYQDGTVVAHPERRRSQTSTTGWEWFDADGNSLGPAEMRHW